MIEGEKRVSTRKKRLNNGTDSYAEDGGQNEASAEEQVVDDGEETIQEYSLERVNELETIAEAIEQGTSSEFINDCQQFKKIRNRKLKAAEMCRSLQMKNIQDLFDFEIQAADHIFKHWKNELRDSMLASVNKRVEELQQELKLLESNDTPTMEKNTSSSKEFISQNSNSNMSEDLEDRMEVYRIKLNEVWQERKKIIPFPPISSSILAPQEALHDLRTVYADWKKEASHVKKRKQVPVVVKKGQLIFNHVIFEVGDAILIRSYYIDEEFVGTISAITNDCLYVYLIDGKDARLPISTLHNKRCSIHLHYQDPSRVTTGVVKRV